ncbi:signal peptide peptidase SppA [Raineyella sp. LH-20]|uniref:signal peptide peptidase SppA n=1 Tax=Raineyella sp. LH-20 TaxID=3081204 RepID=UPI002955B199|nr:signal peptide peptidase SppA [Raineyella sp. LH-20]WOP18106.1 signal peptide peptidase SppA [Raineyella sp. LH-20]
MADFTDRLAAAVRTISDTARPSSQPRPDWAVVDLRGAYPEHSTLNLRSLLAGTESFEALHTKVERLGASDHISHVLVRVGTLTVGAATLDAIAELLATLAARKHVVASLPTISAGTLLLTRTAREITAPPSASVLLTGPAAERTYLGGFLGAHGVGFETERIGRYKSAASTFTDDSMDDAEREQLQAYLDTVRDQWAARVAADRGLPLDQVAGWLSADLVTAEQAAAAGVIDRVAYDDEIVQIDPAARMGALEFVLPTVDRASRRTVGLIRRAAGADRVAVVRVEGMIVSGPSRPGTPFSAPTCGSDTVVGQLRTAKADRSTKAIVLSVNSGGGSAVASDLISREIATAQVPVVASMDDVAASGGYYVASRAREIVASPFTLTGSIGVIMARPVLRDLLQRHGIAIDRLGDDRALMFSAARELTDDERAFLHAMVVDVYDRFVDEVAAGRHRDHDEIDAIGQGRIWSGADALRVGLIDRFGDRTAAVERARELAGLPASAPVWRPSPRPHRGPLAAVPELGRGVEGLLEPFGQEKVLTLLQPGLRVRW